MKSDSPQLMYYLLTLLTVTWFAFIGLAICASPQVDAHPKCTDKVCPLPKKEDARVAH